MAIQKRTYTLEDYRYLCDLPENADKILELIEGDIVEKMTSFTPSRIGIRIARKIGDFVDEHNLGYVTGEAGGYIMPDEDVYIPDVGYISKERLPQVPEREVPVPPDFAVEVKSPTDSKRAMRRKAEKYLAYGTKMVWLVFPESQQVEVYVPDEDVRTFAIDATLDGGDILPGFTLAVKAIFPDES